MNDELVAFIILKYGKPSNNSIWLTTLPDDVLYNTVNIIASKDTRLGDMYRTVDPLANRTRSGSFICAARMFGIVRNIKEIVLAELCKYEQRN